MAEVSRRAIAENIRQCEIDLQHFEEKHQCTLKEYQQRYREMKQHAGDEAHELACRRIHAELVHWECIADRMQHLKADLEKLAQELD